jgi:hypothetical protein
MDGRGSYRLAHFPSRASTIFHMRKSQRNETNAQCTREQFPTNISPKEIAHRPNNPPLGKTMGLTTHLFYHTKFFPRKRLSQMKISYKKTCIPS